MPVIAIANMKGGTGKTTTAMLTAAALHRRGKKAVILDADPQGSATDWYQIVEEDGGEWPAPVKLANVRTLSRLRKQVHFGPEEWTLIDCPPGTPAVIDAAMDAADYLIVPVSPSPIEVDRMWATLQMARGIPTRVLINRAEANTRTLADMIAGLDEESTPRFPVVIPKRQEITRMSGVPIDDTTDLHGYDEVAGTLIDDWNTLAEEAVK